MEYVNKSEFDTRNEQLCTCVSSLIIHIDRYIDRYLFIDEGKSMQTYASLKWTYVHDYIQHV